MGCLRSSSANCLHGVHNSGTSASFPLFPDDLPWLSPRLIKERLSYLSQCKTHELLGLESGEVVVLPRPGSAGHGVILSTSLHTRGCPLCASPRVLSTFDPIAPCSRRKPVEMPSWALAPSGLHWVQLLESPRDDQREKRK